MNYQKCQNRLFLLIWKLREYKEGWMLFSRLKYPESLPGEAFPAVRWMDGGALPFFPISPFFPNTWQLFLMGNIDISPVHTGVLWEIFPQGIQTGVMGREIEFLNNHHKPCVHGQNTWKKNVLSTLHSQCCDFKYGDKHYFFLAALPKCTSVVTLF